MLKDIKSTGNKLKRLLRIISIFILLILLFIYIWYLLSPSGVFKIKNNWQNNIFKSQNFILDFRPGDRIDQKTNSSLIIKAEPVYFSIFSPRNFDKVSLQIKYKNNLASTSPIIEIGVLKDPASNSYDLFPIENRIIDDNFSNWSKLKSGDLSLLQKDNNYLSIDNFLNDLKNNNLTDCLDIDECLLSYNYTISNKFKANNLEEKEIVIDQSLRASHSFYINYLNNNNNLEFKFKDLNIEEGLDNIEIRVYKDKKVVYKNILQDIDSEYKNKKLAEALLDAREIELNINNIVSEKGVYKIEIITNRDIVIDQIISSSDKIVFIDHIWPVDNLFLNSFWTKSFSASFKTYEAESFSEVRFSDKNILITESYKNYYLKNQGRKLSEININKNNVIINVNGFISLSENSYYSPEITEIDRFYTQSENKYLLLNYNFPDYIDNKERIANLSFDIAGLKRIENKYNFVISVPGLELEKDFITSDYEYYLEIEEIKVVFEGKSLFKKMKEIVEKII